MSLFNWYKTRVERRKWNGLQNAWKREAELDKLTPNERRDLQSFQESERASKKERQAQIKWVIGISISLLILLFGILNYFK